MTGRRRHQIHTWRSMLRLDWVLCERRRERTLRVAAARTDEQQHGRVGDRHQHWADDKKAGRHSLRQLVVVCRFACMDGYVVVGA